MSEDDYQELDAHIEFAAWLATDACLLYPLSTCRLTCGPFSTWSRTYALYALMDEWRN